MKRLMTGICVFGIALGLIASPALAFQCPGLIAQANAKLKQVQDLVAEAQRLHNAGQHGESVRKANEALGLLKEVKLKDVKEESKPPARRGYSY